MCEVCERAKLTPAQQLLLRLNNGQAVEELNDINLDKALHDARAKGWLLVECVKVEGGEEALKLTLTEEGVTEAAWTRSLWLQAEKGATT